LITLVGPVNPHKALGCPPSVWTVTVTDIWPIGG
jgi:hypothetical protein